MTTETLSEMLGAVAGTCTTVAFVPQVVKIWKQGGRDLSYGMLVIYLAGVLLWLTYGFIHRAPSIIFANAATGLLVALAAVLKAWTAKRLPVGKDLRGDAAE